MVVADATEEMTAAEWELIENLTKDLKKAAATLDQRQARYLVSTYYRFQEQRIRANSQMNRMSEGAVPSDVMQWTSGLFTTAENNIKRALQGYAEGDPVGEWAMSIKGIGPVIAAGLLAHINITLAPTVGHVWRFAGLDPTVTWGKGQKRPWNADLKVICWRAGESFVKVQNYEDDVYGHIYRERKDLEIARNEAGQFADQAARSLEAKNWRDGTVTKEWYEKGMLPPARIHLRATRYAVKLFLSHLHHVMYETFYHEPPPKPYILTKEEHVHYLAPPNWPMP